MRLGHGISIFVSESEVLTKQELDFDLKSLERSGARRVINRKTMSTIEIVRLLLVYCAPFRIEAFTECGKSLHFRLELRHFPLSIDPKERVCFSVRLVPTSGRVSSVCLDNVWRGVIESYVVTPERIFADAENQMGVALHTEICYVPPRRGLEVLRPPQRFFSALAHSASIS